MVYTRKDVSTLTRSERRRLVNALLELPNVQLTHICDVDQKRIEQARKSVGTRLPEKVKDVRDFHRILDDKSVDALVIGLGIPAQAVQ